MNVVNLPSTRFEAPRKIFFNKINEGIKKRFGTLDFIHEKYLENEINLINDIPDEWIEYLLIISDMVNYLKETYPHCISPGRGSTVSSLIAYLLGITEIDPVPFDLLPERFYINSKIMPIPSIDIEISSNCHDYAIKYLMNKYGDNCVISPIVKKIYKGRLTESKHICAIFLTSLPYYNFTNTTDVKSNSICPVVDLTREECEQLGFVKINLIKGNYVEKLMSYKNEINKDFKIENLTTEDYQRILTLENIEKVEMSSRISSEVKCNLITPTFNDLVFAISITHDPLMEKFLNSKKKYGILPVNSFNDETIDSILKDTHGYIIYQEQVEKILMYAANLNYYSANSTRRNIAKRNKKTIQHTEKIILECLSAKGMSEPDIKRLLFDLNFASVKGTLKSHSISVAYTVVENLFYKEQ